jgi:diguanylate cyclase (GGDEF)-like protein/PAS domain S-box-containing protein
LSEQTNYNQAIETLPNAYARHRVVFDKQGLPVDYIFLQVNSAFEKMTELKRENILGRRVTEVLPGIEKSEFDWIGTYGKVAQGGGSLNFEQYFEPLDRWYDVQAYSDEAGYFTTVFNEITSRKNEAASIRELLKLTEKLIGSDLATIEYHEPAEILLKLSGAKFAAINTYEEDGTKTVTRAITGMPKFIEKASKVLGFKITGQSWDIIPERMRTIEGGKLTRFSSMYETAMGALSETTANMIQKLAGIGDVYVIELAYSGRQTLGDIIFFMPRGTEIQNREAIELYAGQLASLLSRLKTEEALTIANKNMTTVLENSIFGVVIIDKNRTIRWVNPVVCKLAGVESPEELIGRQCGDYLCPAEQHECPILDKGQKLDNSERILRRNDGQTIPILKSVTEIMLEGEEVLLETFIDITDRKQAEEKLRDSELKYRSLTDNLPGIAYRCLYDKDWTMLYMSTAIDSITGYPSEEFINNSVRSYESVIHREDSEMVAREIEAAIKAQNPWDLEYRVLHRNGTVCWVRENGQAITNEQGSVDYLDGLILDISDRKKTEETLAGRLAFEEMLARISTNFVNLPPEQIDEGINYALKSVGEYFEVDRSYLYRFSEDGETYSVTHIWCRDGVEGYFEKDQNVPVELTPWWVGELKSGRLVNIENVAKMGDEATLDRADFLSEEIKSIFTMPLTMKGEVFGCFGFDTVNEQRTWTAEQIDLLQILAELITGAIARHDAERQIHLLSFNDQLTGLYNRRYFEHELERLDNSREHPIAVISADLDGLKLINDTIGHSEGDRYLRAGAEVLKCALRTSDILARVGGDEFALLLPRTDKVATELLINRIRRKIDECNTKQQGLPLSISLGLAVSESADYPLEETFRMADNNMYTDKLQQGKKARAEIVASLLSSLFERGNLAEGERDQVQELAIRLGQALKLPEYHLARLALFTQVYDLGKVGLPDSIIHSGMQNNAGNLTDAEREALHRHPESGYRIASSSPELADIAELILKHHENYDGSGYPLGLKNDAIPVECRILSIAVAYSAMTNPRPYAKTLTHEEALAELNRCAGSQFDPQFVETFVDIIEAIK